jgi:chromosome segregation ATPase
MNERPADDPRPQNQLQDLDRRVNARFQAVAARFSTFDRQLARVSDRLDQQDKHVEAQTARHDARFRSLDSRFDATDTTIDLLQQKITAQLHRERHARRRLVLAAAALSAASWALTLSLLLTTH